jgi:hypothetical protein
MGPTTKPGPNGFPTLFYQTHRDILKNNLCSAVRGFLLGDGIPGSFCDYVIVLIPKVNNPEHLIFLDPSVLVFVMFYTKLL